MPAARIPVIFATIMSFAPKAPAACLPSPMPSRCSKKIATEVDVHPNIPITEKIYVNMRLLEMAYRTGGPGDCPRPPWTRSSPPNSPTSRAFLPRAPENSPARKRLAASPEP